jgi:hypothetical protein
MLAGIHGQSSTIVSSSTIINTPADDDGLRQAELERALTRLQAGIIRGAVIGCTLRSVTLPCLPEHCHQGPL